MTADSPDSPPSDGELLAALAHLAASTDPRDAPPAPTADAVRLAALETTLAARLATADRSAARWRRAALAASVCAASLLAGGVFFARQSDRRAGALAARVAALDAARTADAAALAALDESLAAADARLAAAAVKVAELDDFAGALMEAHFTQSDALAAARRDRAAQRAAIDALQSEMKLARGTADRRFRLLVSDLTAPPSGGS